MHQAPTGKPASADAREVTAEQCLRLTRTLPVNGGGRGVDLLVQDAALKSIVLQRKTYLQTIT